MTPSIVYWALFRDCTGNLSTPKYRIEKEALAYSPMMELIGKDGSVSMYFKPNQSKKPNAPEMNLQAKGSLNFTGLKYVVTGGDVPTFAYGYPYSQPTFSKDKKINPFYGHRFDGYLFILHHDNSTLSRPMAIELMVLAGDEADKMSAMLPSYAKLLQMGVFNPQIEALRKMANADLKPLQ